MARASSTPAAPPEGAVRFSPRNWILFLVALVAIGAGYVFLAQGSTVLAPLLLVLGYVILLPLAIIL